MTSFDYADSQFRFTYPIRFFKANDPIYYEVDNIPLKQLQENDLWLKDQIFNLKLAAGGGIERSDINELRPYVGGFDNIVKVKPGRFTARINDAHNLTALQVIQKITGNSVEEYNTWRAGGILAPEISEVLQRFKQAVAINLNGLVERAFTKLAAIPDYADTTYSSDNTPTIAYVRGVEQEYGQPPYPQVGAVLWNSFTDNRTASIPSRYYVIRQYEGVAPTIGFARLPSAETAFIKKWRGVARTAVVDIAEELNITIPPFDDDDYFYYDNQGVKQYLPANQRVDLIFIYSKPVDTSSVTIAKFVNGSPTTITKPELGIVYGAGLGVNFRQLNTRIQEIISPNGVNKGEAPRTNDDSTLPDGTIKILAHYGDESGQNIGFGTSSNPIKGSFPAPDDLMNISPLLDESLNSNNIALIGQSVLPIAYVVVRKNAVLTTEGTPIINSSDLIDIRPFFRTTELAYNERAGIAAAVPSISIANPVVSQAELDYELKKLRNDIIQRIPEIPDLGGNNEPGQPVPAGNGIVYIPWTEDIMFDDNRGAGKLIFKKKIEEISWNPGTPTTITIPADIIDFNINKEFEKLAETDPTIYSEYITKLYFYGYWHTGNIATFVNAFGIYMSVFPSNPQAQSLQPTKYLRLFGGNNKRNEQAGTLDGYLDYPLFNINRTKKSTQPWQLPYSMNLFYAEELPSRFENSLAMQDPFSSGDITTALRRAPFPDSLANRGDRPILSLYLRGYQLQKRTRIFAYRPSLNDNNGL